MVADLLGPAKHALGNTGLENGHVLSALSSPSGEATSSSNSQEIPRILWPPEFAVTKQPAICPSLSQIKTSAPTPLQLNLKLSSQLRLRIFVIISNI